MLVAKGSGGLSGFGISAILICVALQSNTIMWWIDFCDVLHTHMYTDAFPVCEQFESFLLVSNWEDSHACRCFPGLLFPQLSTVRIATKIGR